MSGIWVRWTIQSSNQISVFGDVEQILHVVLYCKYANLDGFVAPLETRGWNNCRFPRNGLRSIVTRLRWNILKDTRGNLSDAKGSRVVAACYFNEFVGLRMMKLSTFFGGRLFFIRFVFREKFRHWKCSSFGWKFFNVITMNSKIFVCTFEHIIHQSSML